MKIIRPLSLLPLTLASACSVSVNNSLNRFESPETTGKLGRVDLAVAYDGDSQAVLTEDYTSAAPNVTDPAIHRTEDARFSGEVGLARVFDVGIFVPVNGPAGVKGKFQFLGDPQLDAKAGNFSLAATLAFGGSDFSDSSVGNIFDNSAQTTYNVDATTTYYDAALIAGYRPIDKLMIYGGGFYGGHHISGTYKVSPGGSASTSSDFVGTSQVAGANLGVQYFFFSKGYLKLELAWDHAKFAQSTADYLQPGLELGFVFGAGHPKAKPLSQPEPLLDSDHG